MNYYPHHIGDFNSATRHLTRVERSLYRDLIELYYDTEQPLPADDFDRLARRVIAINDEEKEALQFVLDEFFVLDGDLYRHARCDEEIAKYQAQLDAKSRAGKASAKSRQAKKRALKTAKRTEDERISNIDTSTNEQEMNTCSTHEQLTKNQEPRTNITTLSSKPDRVSKKDAVEVLDYLNSKAGRSYRHVDTNLKMIAARLQDGVTVEDCKAVINAKVSQWGVDEKMSEYLRPATLFNRTNFEQYLGQLGSQEGGIDDIFEAAL